MTLCAAWIRQAGTRELIFATDSRLSGDGAVWDTGMKLFDLHRPDCLLCFTGSTRRAYTLILHSTALNALDFSWSYPELDVADLPSELCTLFTTLCLEIDDQTSQGIHELRQEAEFLFGGWTWGQRRPQVWRIHYLEAENGFVSHPLFESETEGLLCDFIGNDLDQANHSLIGELADAGKTASGPLDMEPLRVVAQMARDRINFPRIGGPIQLAKVYGSGRSEFFGVLWPSANGQPTLGGRRIDPHSSHAVRFIDPDTAEIVERFPRLPEFSLETFAWTFNDFGPDEPFVRQCYPNGEFDSTLSRRNRERLQRIWKELLYRKVIDMLEAEAFVAAEEEDEPERFDDGPINLYPEDDEV